MTNVINVIYFALLFVNKINKQEIINNTYYI